MRPSAVPSALKGGREALAQGHWSEAREKFEAILDETGEAVWIAEAWDGIGLASYWLDDPERAVEGHERAFELWRTVGEPAVAARAGIWLVDHYLTFHGAPAVAQGWLERSAALLAPLPEGPGHAWLAVYRGHYALMVERDPASARANAGRARQIAERVGAGEAEMVALALEGLAEVSEGSVRQGMARLDRASATAIGRSSGDFNAAAWACCYLIHGCESVRDFDRAAEWCERVKAYSQRHGLQPIFGSCRAHYASVLTWRGEWEEAERELRETMADARHSRPPIVRSVRVRMAELRLRQGELDEAERLLGEATGHPGTLLGEAVLAHERGRAAEAVALARRYLRNVPAESRTDRVDGLSALALAGAEAGDEQAVEAAAAELEDIARAAETPLLEAAARLAGGLAARVRGKDLEARTALEDAAVLFERGGAPFEAARARLLLAERLVEAGEDPLARRELGAAGATFRRLGAAPRAEAVDARLARLEADSPDPEGGGPSGPLTTRELEVLALVAEGLTNADIARRLYLSPHTVKRHVANILGKLDQGTRAAAVATATREGWL